MVENEKVRYFLSIAIRYLFPLLMMGNMNTKFDRYLFWAAASTLP